MSSTAEALSSTSTAGVRAAKDVAGFRVFLFGVTVVGFRVFGV